MCAIRLVERVGAGSPVGEEQAEADSLEYTGEGTDGDLVKRALLGDDLGDKTGGGAGEEDERSEVSSTLVAESTSCVDQSTDTVGLEGATSERATPSGGSAGGLL